MANELKGITVRIDAGLHAEIKKYLEDNNMTMAEFITHAVDDELHPKLNTQEENKVEKMRTLAFQVPEDLFQRIKGYLARTGMSQKNFVIGLIEEELDRDEEMRAAENTPEVQGEDTSEESADIAAGDIVDVVDETEDESETYGEGPEDPIYMEGNLGSETEESGEPGYENMFRHYAWKYSDRISANICYSDDLAHKLYAAADAFLMPSRFEPCGLTQLISFRYGTAPIVRETGGLKDTVVPFNEYDNTGDGFSFSNYNGEEMLKVINYAKSVYYDKKKDWNKMIDRGMAKDFSWNASKFRYEGLYNYLIGDK